MKLDIICFGALNIDRLFRVDRIAEAGGESVILDFKENPGGSAANTAVGLARLGVKTGYIGKVAADREGRMIIEDLRREGVDTRGVIIAEDGRSGVVMGFIDATGERALYVDPGVNDEIDYEEIDVEYAREARYLHLSSFAGERSLNAQIELVKKTPDLKVTLDPGEIYARKGWSRIKELIVRCYAILPNKRELELLTGMDYKRGARKLIDAGVEIVAVKLGGRGCYVTDGREEHIIKPYRVNVVDTTGAGDAFCAGFLYGLIMDKPLEECGLIGNFVASRCIMKMGARSGLPKLEEIPVR